MDKKYFVMFVMLLLTACSQYVSNGEKYYLYSKNGAIVTVPSPLTDTNLSHFYVLPQQNENAIVTIKPPN